MKNVTEWSLEFDLLWNNIMSDKAPGLNEYEKSVFLTRAEEVVEIALYNGKLTEPFEETEEVTSYLNTLVSQYNCPLVLGGVHHIIPSSQVFRLPGDCLFRTLEICEVNVDGCGSMYAIVIPVTQDEFWRTYRNPFKGPNAHKVLRLSYGNADETNGQIGQTDFSELVSKYPVSSYVVRYLKKPQPIILADLDEWDASINGQTQPKTCLFPEALHQTILTEAVKLAKAVWNS